jgi:hypothetical protein
VEGVVTTPATLLDGSGRRVIVQDRTAAVEVLLPDGAAAPAVGRSLRVAGDLGTAYGAPRIRAATVVPLGRGALPAPRRLAGEPGAQDEGELVRVDGEVVDVRRLGDRWRAEVRSGATTFVVAGLAGAGIPAATLAEGGRASVIGVVRRPHPAASDRRFAVVPRGPGDVRAGPAAASAPASPGSSGGQGSAGASSDAGTDWTDGVPPAGTVDVDLDGIARHVGQEVRVGGLVVAATEASVVIDDGTATGELRLSGDAAPLAALLEPGDAVSAVGRVVAGQAEGTGPAVEVTDPAGIVRLGELGEALPIELAAGPAQPGAAPGGAGGRGASATVGETAGAGSPDAPSVPPGLTALALALVLALAGIAAGVGLARRRRARRAVTDRIAARLASLGGPPGSVAGLPSTLPGAAPAAALAAGAGTSVRDHA